MLKISLFKLFKDWKQKFSGKAIRLRTKNEKVIDAVIANSCQYYKNHANKCYESSCTNCQQFNSNSTKYLIDLEY